MSTLCYFINQMEKVNFGYSLKNIPTPNERPYKLQLIEKVELFIKKLRWKAILFINNSKEITELCESDSVYGLKSNKCFPQRRLHEDFKKMSSSKKTLSFADKTSNMYRLDKEEASHLLQNVVTTT